MRASILAPSGTLRAAINLANPVLAGQGADGPAGVSVDMARAFAASLGLPLLLVPYDGAGQVVAAGGRGEWDVAFLAVEPGKAGEIWFSSPYVQIEGTFLVPEHSPLRDIAEFDRAGVRIAVAERAAYDLHLTRSLRHAALVRFASPEASFEGFVRNGLEAAAGIRQALDSFARSHRGYRVCDGWFLKIEQAMALPRAREAAGSLVNAFLTRIRAEGFVRWALDAHGHAEVKEA